MTRNLFSGAKILSFALFLIASMQVTAEVGFDAYINIITGSDAEAVAIGDLNNDGRNDVALITSVYFDPDNDYMLKVYLQDVNGYLGAAINYPLIAEYTKKPSSLDLGDLNNDGLVDVAVGLDRGYIQIFTQDLNGNLGLTNTITTTYSTRIQIGDLNNDGLDDICGIGWGGQNVGVFYQSGNAINSQEVPYYAPHGGYDDIELGDVNNDGFNDIVVMSGQGNIYDNIAVVLSNFSGQLVNTEFYNLPGNDLARGVAVGDVNGDGMDDIAVTHGGNQPNSMMSVFLQNGLGQLGLPVSYTSYDIPEPIIAADLNHDDKSELIIVHGGWQALGVYEQQPDGTLLPEQLFDLPYASHYNPHGLDIGDINSDGINDAVIADYNYGLVVLYGNVPPPLLVNPVADAGPNQVVEQSDLVSLNGSLSYDEDGTIVTYSWTQIAGDGVPLNYAESNVANFAVPLLPPGQTADLVFLLTVVDDDGLEAVDTASVHVIAREAPIANAGLDQQVEQNSQVNLDASQSYDNDGSVVSYDWTQVSGVSVQLDNADTAAANFTVPILPAGQSDELVFQLTITDDDGLVDVDTVSVQIVANLAPNANAGTDFSIQQRDTGILNASSSFDSDGVIVSYLWTQVSGEAVAISDSTSALATFEAPKLRGSSSHTLVFEITVVDNLNQISTDQVRVTVTKH